MKIVIHGAISTSNFGDVLFAKLFYDACKKIPNADVDFAQIPRFGVSDFVRKETGYNKFIGKLGYLKADVLIMMSGGYLGLDTTDLCSVFHLYVRFILPARLFQLLKKPVYIIGVGGGPIDSLWLRKSIMRLIDHSDTVIARDEETKNYFVEYGAEHKIEVTTDTALCYTEKPDTSLLGKPFDEEFKNKKIIFLHVGTPEDSAISAKIVPSLNKFLQEHRDYGVVIGHDNLMKHTPQEFQCWKLIDCMTKYAFEYKSVEHMLALISRVDCIITTKLHVGIFGALFGKSVVSFAMHREKTQRFYRQIGFPERCIHFSRINDQVVFQQLQEYHDKPITVPESLIDKAQSNLLFTQELESRFS